MFRPTALRLPLRQSLRRRLHTTPRRLADNPKVTWKTPFEHIPFKLSMPSLVWLGVGSLLLTFPLWFKQPLPTDTTQQHRQKPPVHGSTVPDVTVQLKSAEEPVPPTEDFPELLDLEGRTFKLVAWGVRTVSFLGIRVYNVGLYIPETEYDVLPTYSLSHTSPADSFSTLIRIFSYPLLLRIIPTRNTDFAHLRDGFVRSTSQRLKVGPEERERVDDAVARFKKLFPGGKMKKGEVLTLLQWGPEVRLYVGGKMEEDLGGVKNDEFARGLMGAYLVGDNVVSPDLLGKLTVKVKAIADEAKELVQPIKGKETKI